jgi:hypothetical protein
VSTPTIKDIRAAAAARKQSRERRRKLLVSVVVVGLVLGVGIFFGISPLVESQLSSRLELMLKRNVEVGEVTFDLLTFTTTFEDVRVRDHDGSEMLTWDRMVMNGRLAGVISGAWSADAIALEGFTARLVVNEQGRLNVADVLTALAEDEEGARPFEVGRLSVTDAQLIWIDASRDQPFETTLGPVTFSLSGLHTQSDPNSPYEFEAVTESGESLVWDGTLSLSPFRSQGRWEMRGLRLAKYEPYLHEVSSMEFTSGVIDASSAYEIDWIDGALKYRLSDGQLVVNELTATTGPGSDLEQSIGKLTVAGLDYDSIHRTLTIGRVVASQGAITLQRDSIGWSWMDIKLGEDATRFDSAGGLNLETARMDEMELNQIDVRIDDRSVAIPVEFEAKVTRATIEEWDLMRLSQRSSITLDAQLATGGTVSLRGEAALQPFRPVLDYEFSDFAIASGPTYLDDVLGVKLARGELSARGEFSGMAGKYEISGSGRITDLLVHDSSGNELGSAKLAEISDFSVAQDPAAIRIETMALTEPRTRLVISKSGEWGFARSESPSEIKFRGPERRSWEIDTIDVADGQITLRDESTYRPISLSVAALDGLFTGWTSRDSRTAKLKLRGVLQGSAPVTMEGGLNPLSDAIFADVRISAQNLSARIFDGYLARYLGYEITAGNVTLDIDAELRDGIIESETVTRIERAALGKKVASPEAIDAPVKFGLSLIPDAQGKIVVSVPVSGRVGDPEFSFGRGFGRVFSDLLAKAVSSPFAFLGAGGEANPSGAHLQNHAFAAGETRLSDEVKQKLDMLGKLLADRPMLRLEVSGGYDRQDDRAKLLPEALEWELRRRAAPGSFAASGDLNSPSRIQALVELYQETFNELPIDLDGELPPPEVSVEHALPPEPETKAEQEKRSLLVWLRRLFIAGDNSTTVGSRNDATPPAAPLGSFPAPAGMRKELALLPVEEIVRRLLAEQTVSDSQFRDLGRERVEAVRAHLQQAGIHPSRLMVGAIEAGSAIVTLDLR